MSILRRIREQRLVARAYSSGYEQGRCDERLEGDLTRLLAGQNRRLFAGSRVDIPGRIATAVLGNPDYDPAWRP